MKCPKCGGRRFRVIALYAATQYVSFEPGEPQEYFEVEDYSLGGSDWVDGENWDCRDCGHSCPESDLIPEPIDDVRDALDLLKGARDKLKRAGAVKTVERVRLAISSAKGARRHAENLPYRLAEMDRKGEEAA
jgi:hypothetical protein